MNYIKKRIIHWLGIDHIVLDYVRVSQELRDLKSKQDAMVNPVIQLRKDMKFCKDMMSIGIDHHIKQKSWMVVCTKCGKKERVKFYEIPDNHIGVLNDLLHDLEKNNVVIDAHPAMRSMLNKTYF